MDWRPLGLALALLLGAVVLSALTQRTDFEDAWGQSRVERAK